MTASCRGVTSALSSAAIVAAVMLHRAAVHLHERVTRVVPASLGSCRSRPSPLTCSPGRASGNSVISRQLVAVFGYPQWPDLLLSEEEARRGSPLGGVTYWDDTAEGGPSGSSHETHASGTSPGNTEGDQDGTDRVS